MGMGSNALHEHFAPTMVFSVAALSQLHFCAGCAPQEHVASRAQGHSPEALERPQQVLGMVDVGAAMVVGCGHLRCKIVVTERKYGVSVRDGEVRWKGKTKVGLVWLLFISVCKRLGVKSLCVWLAGAF